MDCDYSVLSLDCRGAVRRPASFSFHATALCSTRSRQMPAFSTARGMGLICSPIVQ